MVWLRAMESRNYARGLATCETNIQSHPLRTISSCHSKEQRCPFQSAMMPISTLLLGIISVSYTHLRDIALERGMIDRATDDFASFAPLADVIILTLPIKQTIAFIKELANLDLKEGVIISDAGSTKSAIVDAAEEYLAGKPVHFVGAHPMAGSHKDVYKRQLFYCS